MLARLRGIGDTVARARSRRSSPGDRARRGARTAAGVDRRGDACARRAAAAPASRSVGAGDERRSQRLRRDRGPVRAGRARQGAARARVPRRRRQARRARGDARRAPTSCSCSAATINGPHGADADHGRRTTGATGTTGRRAIRRRAGGDVGHIDAAGCRLLSRRGHASPAVVDSIPHVRSGGRRSGVRR